MANYSLKSKVLNDIRFQQLLSLQCYFRHINVVDNPKILESKTYLNNLKLYNELISDTMFYREFKRLTHAQYSRTSRLRKRLLNYLALGNCIFLTMTFTDDFLSRSTFNSRRTLIVRYLKSQSNNYIANIDYGSKNGREHYHAVIVADSVDYQYYRKLTNSSINGQRVRFSFEDCDLSSIVRLPKYLSKLTNHAIKATTKRCAIIYSR